MGWQHEVVTIGGDPLRVLVTPPHGRSEFPRGGAHVKHLQSALLASGEVRRHGVLDENLLR